jgi:hypothetical protein
MLAWTSVVLFALVMGNTFAISGGMLMDASSESQMEIIVRPAGLWAQSPKVTPSTESITCARLEALPWANNCVECQEQSEQTALTRLMHVRIVPLAAKFESRSGSSF